MCQSKLLRYSHKFDNGKTINVNSWLSGCNSVHIHIYCELSLHGEGNLKIQHKVLKPSEWQHQLHIHYHLVSSLPFLALWISILTYWTTSCSLWCNCSSRKCGIHILWHNKSKGKKRTKNAWNIVRSIFKPLKLCWRYQDYSLQWYCMSSRWHLLRFNLGACKDAHDIRHRCL